MMPPRGAASTLDPTASRSEFDELFDGEFHYVWNTLRRLGVSERDLEDVTHDVFLQVYARFDSYDRGKAPRPWLFGFSYRIAADYRRLARHRLVLVGDAAELDVAAQMARRSAECDATREAVDLVERALARLEFEQRAVFVMHDIDGCAMPEVAAAFEIPVNTAYSRLRLARARFAAAVRQIQLTRGERK
jgi:RNA polymerase sigma-70 factor (ECF subfamily)